MAAPGSLSGTQQGTGTARQNDKGYLSYPFQFIKKQGPAVLRQVPFFIGAVS
jgi:hypothetical protein